MSERRLDNWLTRFVEFAEIGEAPHKTLLWTGISTIAGALRRQVWIDFPFYQWTPNFYIILVAPPGIVSKSTTANIGMNLLREIPGIKFGPDVVTWQALIQKFAESTEAVLEPATGNYHSMSALTLVADEFGSLFKPEDREMVDTFTSLWDGKRGTYSKITKTNGEDLVENVWINILACTTPGWLKSNLPESLVGGGFTSRCIFVFADKKRQYVAYPDEYIPKNFEAQKADLIHDLEAISQMIGAITLSEEARIWGRQWYREHSESQPVSLRNDKFAGYLARKQTHFHKLAIVISAARSSDLVITLEDLIVAEGLVTALENEMPKVFESFGQTVIGRGITELIRATQVEREIPMGELYRQFQNKMGKKEYEDALNSAVLTGHISIESRGNIRYIVALDTPKGE